MNAIRTITLVAVLALSLPGLGRAQEGTAAESPADMAAKVFLSKCAGCHSVGGEKRAAPDLLAVISWKPADLESAVKRMEKNTGALPPEEVSALVSLLQDSSVRTRLATEESRAVVAAAATLDPPSAQVGEALFLGNRRFLNGGSSCAACHSAAGEGGSLGPDLTAVHARLGDMALVSAIEKASYRVMKPIYETRPVTAQEAAHVASYLATTGSKSLRPQPPVGVLAVGGSIVALGLLGFAARGAARRGTRARLVAESSRR